MAYAPWLPKNHLEVLDGHPEKFKTSLPRQLYYPGMMAGACLLGGLYSNWAQRRPLTAGVHKTAALVILGGLVGQGIARFKEYYARETNARMRHYVETHRDLFPDYEMVKVGDILEPWKPCR